MPQDEDFQERMTRVRARLSENPGAGPLPRPPGVPPGHEAIAVPRFDKPKTSAGSALRWGLGMGVAVFGAAGWSNRLGFPVDAPVPLRTQWAAETLAAPVWTAALEQAAPALTTVFFLGIAQYLVPAAMLLRRRWDPHHVLVYAVLMTAVILVCGLLGRFTIH